MARKWLGASTDYLASLEKGVDELLKEKEAAEAKAQSERDGKPAPKPEAAKSGPEPRAEPTSAHISKGTAEGPDRGADNR